MVLASLLEKFIDKSEAEAIVLTLEIGADILLVDNRDARSLAKSWDYKIMIHISTGQV